MESSLKQVCWIICLLQIRKTFKVHYWAWGHTAENAQQRKHKHLIFHIKPEKVLFLFSWQKWNNIDYIYWQKVALTYFDMDIFWHLFSSPVENHHNEHIMISKQWCFSNDFKAFFMFWSILSKTVNKFAAICLSHQEPAAYIHIHFSNGKWLCGGQGLARGATSGMQE